MEIFYAATVNAGVCLLDKEEAVHCTRVFRHRVGDEIMVVDGKGLLYRCRLCSVSTSSAEAAILETTPGWGGHPYHLTMAVCPTKNADRYEFFAEKATEIGVDAIVPVIGEHSERRIYKTERIKRLLVAAMKQSLKSALPEVSEPISVKEFIEASAGADALKLIACCLEDEVSRISIKEALNGYEGRNIMIMIGPEGDFSVEEVRQAVAAGFIPVHLGQSRLRTETAAITAVEAVYFKNL